jgi:hypothetical protein
MNKDYLIEDIKLTYKILNHKGPSELRLLKEGSFPIIRFANNEEDFLKICIEFNNKRNVYVGIRDRKKDIKNAAKREDIVGLNLTVIDIDPLREKNYPSSEIELKNAIHLSQKIKDYFIQNGFKSPYTAVTGNGASIFFVFPYTQIDDDNRFEIEDGLYFFENFIREKFKKDFNELNLRIDSIYDLPRIVRVIGTKNIKGEESQDRPHRVSYWIDKPYSITEDSKLLSFILNRGVIFDTEKLKPIWLMQPIPYFGEKLFGEWIVEPKVDGWRIQIIKDKGKICFFGRRLEKNPDWSEKLNIDKEIFKYVPDGTILDGELISDKGRRFIPSLFSNTKKANPIIYIFDIIFYKYEFVGDHPLIKRKELINSIKFLEPVKILNFKKLKDLEEDLRESIKEGHEGIVIKELNSKYILGRDAPMVTLYWKKIKGIRR